MLRYVKTIVVNDANLHDFVLLCREQNKTEYNCKRKFFVCLFMLLRKFELDKIIIIAFCHLQAKLSAILVGSRKRWPIEMRWDEMKFRICWLRFGARQKRLLKALNWSVFERP